MKKPTKSNQDLIEEAKKEAEAKKAAPSGSPVTTGTVDPGEPGGTEATKNNQSLTPVQGVADTTPVREEDLPNVAADPGASPEPVEPKDAEVVADPEETEEQRKAREEFEAALNEPDVAETPSEEELDAVDPIINVDEEGPARAAATRTSSNRNISAMVRMLKDKKSSFIIYGYGGVIITLGDLREAIGESAD